MVDNPITRKEKYLAKLTGSYTGNVPDPITRVEKYLYDLCQKGISGLTPEEIENAVNKYLKENPVQPGATEEQAQQIKKNADDVASLKEDISTKITKFYASSQGETHITDSDNGKIQDMMIYGKSSQDGTPTPENPVEIKSVVNPTVKVCGKNLWDNFKTLSSGNVEQKNGTYIATTSTMQVDLTPGSVGVRPLLLKANNTYTFSLKTTVSISSNKYVCLTYTNGKNKNIIFNNKNFIKFVPERDVEKIGFILYGSVAGDKAYDVQLEMGSEATSYEPYHEQTVTLPYTLNAIPVSSGGNVTIDGQQYVSDYVDVERGKRVQRIIKYKITGDENIYEHASGWIYCDTNLKLVAQMCATNIAKTVTDQYILSGNYIRSGATGFYFTHNDIFTDVNAFKNYVKNNDVYVYAVLQTPEEIDLTPEEITAFKELATYYPTTNISVNSEQLDGYTVFNYPISMKNGWDYVKQQIGDTRNYIYDMDARTQDTDLQAAEAYVNSEYAVALTELEV
jgi:hypothetical protein